MKKLSIITASILVAAMLAGCSESGSSSQQEQASSQEASSSAQESASDSSEAKTYKSIKLMTCGDSITDGFWQPGGYRRYLADRLEMNDLSQYVDFVGSKKGGECYDNEHEGYTGWSIDRIENSITGGRMGVSSILPKKIEKYQPDVVTLMIGTNDLLSHYELDKAGDRLSALIDAMFEKMPEGAVLFVATVPDMDADAKIPDVKEGEVDTYIDQNTFTSEYMDECVANYNEQVKAVVEKKKGEGKNIVLVDVHSALTKQDLYDGVHPSDQGYKILGDFWYDIITDYITE